MNEPGGYLEVSFDIPRDYCDAVCNFVIENITGGIVLEDEDDRPSIGLRFYVPIDDDGGFRKRLDEYLQALIEQGMEGPPEITTRPIHSADWEDAYRQSVRPIRALDEVGIRPPWFDRDPEVVHDIIVEPKMAFGTGQHETTRSCLKAVHETMKPGYRVLDVGCGSGILSILADKLGARYIKAVDYDAAAVDNCRENFEINEVRADSDIRLGSIEQADGDPPYDLVVANIITDTIVEMMPQLKAAVAPGGVLIVSGILDRYDETLVSALAEHGLTDYGVIADNEWRTYVVRRGEGQV
jgi:ribosomal protein L11 methyltransferase